MGTTGTERGRRALSGLSPLGCCLRARSRLLWLVFALSAGTGFGTELLREGFEAAFAGGAPPGWSREFVAGSADWDRTTARVDATQQCVREAPAQPAGSIPFDGTASGTPFSWAQNTSVAVGDFNGDGNPDIVCTKNLAGRGSIELSLNSGARTAPLGGAEPLLIGANDTTAIAKVEVGDLNGDGLLDVAVLPWGSEAVRFYLNTGSAADPFTGAVAQDISTDLNAGKPIAAGRFQSHRGRIVSLAVDGRAEPILAATLHSVTIAFNSAPTDTTPSWAWAGGGGGGNGRFRHQLDSSAGAWTEAAALSFTAVAALADGPHRLYVRERDAAGNWSGSGSGEVTIDTLPPSVVEVTSAHANGTFTVGEPIDVIVRFSEPVWASGSPELRLETGAVDAIAILVTGSGTNALTFLYTVLPGHASADLDYPDSASLVLNGGSVRDAAANSADLTLPAPGSTHSLGWNRDLAVRTTYTVTFLPGARGILVGGTPAVSLTVNHGDPAPTPAAVTAGVGWLMVGWSPRLSPTITAAAVTTAQYTAAATLPPEGAFLATVDVVAPAACRLWDPSGTYSTTTKDGLLSLDLVHDSKGGLGGTATYTIAKDRVVTMPIKGSVKGASGCIAMKGTLRGADPAATVSVSLTLDLTVVTAARQLAGLLTGSVESDGETVPVNESLTLPIPGSMDGTWTLVFNLEQSRAVVTGVALLTLSSGAHYSFSVKGKVGAGGIVIISLAGDPADPAAKGIRIRTAITTAGRWLRTAGNALRERVRTDSDVVDSATS